MFGIGMTEMIVIAVIALIFIGPDQIPEVARTVGRFLNDLRRSTDDIKRQFSDQAGLPRDLNGLEEWQRRRDEMYASTQTLPEPQETPPASTQNQEVTESDQTSNPIKAKSDSGESGNA